MANNQISPPPPCIDDDIEKQGRNPADDGNYRMLGEKRSFSAKITIKGKLFHRDGRGMEGWKIKPQVFLAAAIGLVSLRFPSQQSNLLKLPLRFVTIQFLIAFIAAFGGILLNRSFPKIANAAAQLGTAFTAMGTFTLMGYMLSDSIVWVAALSCFFTLASFAVEFVKRT